MQRIFVELRLSRIATIAGAITGGKCRESTEFLGKLLERKRRAGFVECERKQRIVTLGLKFEYAAIELACHVFDSDRLDFRPWSESLTCHQVTMPNSLLAHAKPNRFHRFATHRPQPCNDHDREKRDSKKFRDDVAKPVFSTPVLGVDLTHPAQGKKPHQQAGRDESRGDVAHSRADRINGDLFPVRLHAITSPGRRRGR